MNLKIGLSWRLKIALKIMLSRIPLPYEVCRRWSMFKHGAMHDTEYALAVVGKHLERVRQRYNLQDFTCLEMGPGDSLFTAIMAQAQGARQSWLVDVGRFVVEDLEAYRNLSDHLRQQGLPAPKLAETESIDDVVKACNSRYLVNGLAAYREIPSASVDALWSHAVLEHVRRNEFTETIAETYRVLKPGGIASHCIDLQDHLGGRLSNLRFSERVWEGSLFANSGFYTNRIRWSEMLSCFHETGFDVEVVEEHRWPSLPTPRKCLHPSFRRYSDHDLCVFGFSVVLTKPIHAVASSLPKVAPQAA